MKKWSWLIVVLLLCIIALLVQISFHACGWIDTLLQRSGCIAQLKSAGIVYQIAFSPNEQILATLSSDQSVRLWDLNDITLRHKLNRNSDTPVYDLAFTPDGTALAIVLWDSIQLWRVSDGVLLDTIEIIAGTPFAFSPDGTILATGALKLWQLDDRTLLRQLQKNQFGGLYTIKTIAFSPDGTILASGAANGILRLWRVKDGKLLNELTGHSQGVKSVAFSPDGTILASGSVDNTVRIWRVSDGQLLRILKRPKHLLLSNQINTIAFSPDGKVLAAEGGINVLFWRVSDGILLHTLTHNAVVGDLGFSSDGTIFATTKFRGPVSLFDVQKWNLGQY